MKKNLIIIGLLCLASALFALYILIKQNYMPLNNEGNLLTSEEYTLAIDKIDGSNDQTYSLIEQISNSLSSINAEVYFSSTTENSNPADFLDYDRDLVEDISRARAYEETTEAFCAPIIEAYEKILSRKIEGQNIYHLDQELIMAAQSSGWYTLPLRVDSVSGKAVYKNNKWGKTDYDGKYGRRVGDNGLILEYLDSHEGRTYDAIRKVLRFSKDGLINVEAKTLLSYIPFKDFYMIASNDFSELLHVEDYRVSIKMVRGFLKVLDKDTNNIESDRVYLYVDFPFNLHGTSFADFNLLSSQQDGKNGVDCIVQSVSEARSRGRARANFVEGEAKDSFISKFSHLNIAKTQSALIAEETLKLEASEIVNPSLKCWLELFHFDYPDKADCNGLEYSKEYIKILNEDICVGIKNNTSLPKVTFPITDNSQNSGTPLYSRDHYHINSVCTAEK